ncbi:glycoside hydrolase [Fomitiporia mediterranea MF3/22]|uniref:glycoside hydrolase n=1 Tax=Fomitiporia mediterranea (strain MF3/22) TaxID=694068 RepID=UPI000440772B|nr:glycoside hydrolase [Fomitiporia mediterranea MF3/22]EJD01206.1 glycoside hydrolase [Fomitiporia mediterranea MF3/22]
MDASPPSSTADSSAAPSSDVPDSPAPSQTGSNATNVNSTSGYSEDNGPAFATHIQSIKGPLVSAYYPGWAANVLSPENIDMSRLDWLDFAFGTPDENFNINIDDADVLNRLVSAAHSQGTKVKLSIGGWTDSKYFSTACADSDSRSTLVNNIVDVYNQYNLDGIDIDWEYPGQQGNGGNEVSPDDSANFLKMLKLLRSNLPDGARITAAVQDVPFAGPDGNPMDDVSEFASVLDWVNIMNYDVFSSSANPGPNGPLDNGCNDSSQPQFNAVAAVKQWTDANFPASHLMLGVPFYGYLSDSSATQLQHRKRSLSRRQVPQVPLNGTAVTSALPLPQVSGTSAASPVLNATGSLNVTAGAPIPTLHTPGTHNEAQTPEQKPSPNDDGYVTLHTEDGGQIQFNSVVNQGALVPVREVNGNHISADTTFDASGGFTRYWDSCSSTPFMTSPYVNQVVTYDDPRSLGLKASFAKQQGVLGTAIWDLSGDTPQWDLIDALRSGLGKSVN